MERMDMHSRKEYLKVVRERYFEPKTKKEKSEILDEYCRNTGQSRKYVITKIHKADFRPKQRKKRKRHMMARLELSWLRYGKSLIVLVDKGLSLCLRRNWTD
jgi:hypothetical protein